jgi:hypothetical protein
LEKPKPKQVKNMTTVKFANAKAQIRARVEAGWKSPRILKETHKLFPKSSANVLHVRKYVSELLNEKVIDMDARNSYYDSGRARPTAPIGRTAAKIKREADEAAKEAKKASKTKGKKAVKKPSKTKAKKAVKKAA